MKKIWIFVLSALLTVSAAFVLASCAQEITIGMELTVPEELIDSIDRVHFGANQAYRPMGDGIEQNVFIVDDTSHKGKTVDVEIRFNDGFEPIAPKLTLDGADFTDFTVETDPNNEFSKYLSFQLSCGNGARFSMEFDAEGMKKLDKDLAIDLVLPEDEYGKAIVEDFAGTPYLDVISILAHKNGESEPQYYTLAEIAQLGSSAPKATFRAHVEIAHPVNSWIPIVHVKSASQYVNAYSFNAQNDVDKESWITKMFGIGDNQLFLSKYAYDVWTVETEDRILRGDLNLSLEEDRLISGADTLTIDARVMASADGLNKTYSVRTDGLEWPALDDLRWQFSEQMHTYGMEEEFVLTPKIINNSKLLTPENIDLTHAKVLVNGVEIASRANTEDGVHTLAFTLGKADSSSRIGGNAANDPDGTLAVVVRDIGLRGLEGRVLTWEFPFLNQTLLPTYAGPLFSGRLPDAVVGHQPRGNVIRYTIVLPDTTVEGGENVFCFPYHEFGYKSFKLKLTASDGKSYTTSEINALAPSADPIAFNGFDFATATIDAPGNLIRIALGDSEHLEGLTWDKLSGYKVEFVDTTDLDSIVLEFDPSCEFRFSTFEVDGVETPFTGSIELNATVTYHFIGVATGSQFEKDRRYRSVCRFYAADGTELSPLVTVIPGEGGANDAWTNGELHIDDGFYVSSLCRVANVDGELKQIVRAVYTLEPSE